MNLFKKKELVVVEKSMPPVTEQTVTDYMKAFGLAGNLQDNEVEAFKQMAVMHNLNPFNREIYCTAYGSGEYRTLSIVTGYEVYIRKAEQSGLLSYWNIMEASPETPLDKYWAKLVIRRRDKMDEQSWTTYYLECVQRKKDGKTITAFWQKQPRMMTKKVAMSQGFRLFFEDVMHGIPYTREEMPEEKGGMTDVTPAPKAKNITPDKIIMKKEEYEKEKDKVIELVSQQDDPEVPDNQPELVTEKPQQSGAELKDIVKLVNESGNKIPSGDKGGIILQARDADPKAMQELYDKLKGDYKL